ncbi:hypothetical protein FH063_006703 [Azospirillum argentinense]|uniref:Uncharacterized protein n=1 Tax=Azospirillum argentinense TaxID=2970906 RepID=A0A5B0KP48_9PROT|nr:hypothetical protein FH063_006703 [Azospirillum argentinense]
MEVLRPSTKVEQRLNGADVAIAGIGAPKFRAHNDETNPLWP